MDVNVTGCRLVALSFFAVFLIPLRADNTTYPSSSIERNLGDLSIEQLMNEPVTSVSKRETKLHQSPAAISVVSADDIRRLGFTSIPEALRLVPGLDVAQVNSSQWAVSSRGFNFSFANKLLVMIDGRPVYTPSFGGVLWYAQDVMMEDLDRIEVIRGPGATLWGANAVNGVINIITATAKDTQGGLITNSFGTEDRPTTSVRYGGQLASNLYYRVYVKYLNRASFVDPSGVNTPDDWNAFRSGARLDWTPSNDDKLTVEGNYYSAKIRANTQEPTLISPYFLSSNSVHTATGGDVLGRWTHPFSSTSELVVQTYYDTYTHFEGNNQESRHTFDVDLQHRFVLGTAQEIVWGGGYRSTTDEGIPNPTLIWNPPGRHDRIFSAFIQDDIALSPNELNLTLGSKFEHNDYTGYEVQPGVRLLWLPDPKHTVWSSVSRAVRTPTRVETDTRFNLLTVPPSQYTPPILVATVGNPLLKSEELIAYELGYRVEATKQLLFDATAFYNVYNRLISYDAGTPRFDPAPLPGHLVIDQTAQNSLSGETYGAEISVQWQATTAWKLIASYTRLNMRVHPVKLTEGDSPQNQAQLRSYTDLLWHLQLNSSIAYADSLPNQAIPSYIRLDIGIIWRPVDSLELGVWGQNLLDKQHPEFGSYITSLRTEVPRSVLSKITWRY